MQGRVTLGQRFWKLWAAVAISSLGDGMLEVALPFLALSFTRNPITISAVWMALLVPELLLAIPVGTIADRLNRRSIIVAVEAGRFLVAGSFGLALLLHAGSMSLLLATAFLMGALNMTFDVVCGAAVPSVVSSDSLVRANAHLANAELTSENLIGQAVGGAALAAARCLPFISDAFIFAVGGLLVRRAVPDNEPSSSETSTWADSRQGLRWFFQQPALRLVTAVIGGLAFCQAISLGILPLYAKERLHLGGTGFGLLLAVGSIGVVIGGTTAPRLHARLGTGPVIMLSGLLAASAYPVLALTRSAVVAAAALIAEATAIVCGTVVSRALRQRLVPDNMQGRAGSAFVTVIRGAQPMGAVAGGLMASAVGLQGAFLAAATLQVVVLSTAGTRLISRIRGAEASSPDPDAIDLIDGGDGSLPKLPAPTQIAG